MLLPGSKAVPPRCIKNIIKNLLGARYFDAEIPHITQCRRTVGAGLKPDIAINCDMSGFSIPPEGGIPEPDLQDIKQNQTYDLRPIRQMFRYRPN